MISEGSWLFWILSWVRRAKQSLILFNVILFTVSLLHIISLKYIKVCCNVEIKCVNSFAMQCKPLKGQHDAFTVLSNFPTCLCFHFVLMNIALFVSFFPLTFPTSQVTVSAYLSVWSEVPVLQQWILHIARTTSTSCFSVQVGAAAILCGTYAFSAQIVITEMNVLFWKQLNCISWQIHFCLCQWTTWFTVSGTSNLCIFLFINKNMYIALERDCHNLHSCVALLLPMELPH